MAKYLVILKLEISGGGTGNIPCELTEEYNVNCDPGELSDKIKEKKSHLHNIGRKVSHYDSDYTITVTTIQVLPL